MSEEIALDNDSKINIRQANEDDLGAILALHRQLGDKAEQSLNLKEANEMFAKFSQYPYYKVFIAEIQGQTVGTFALLIMNNIAHKGAPSGVIEDVVVSQDHRSKGIGKIMMNFAMEQCRKQGCYKVALSSNSKRIDAHRFYESLGFVKHGYSFSMNLPKA